MADSVATKAILLIAGAVILNFGFRQYQPALPANALPGSVYKGQYFEKVVGVWALFIRVSRSCATPRGSNNLPGAWRCGLYAPHCRNIRTEG